MQTLQKQKGLTFISWLIIFIMAGFLVYVVLNIIPVYIDHFAIEATLESVKQDPLSASKSSRELRDTISKRLDVNNIRHVTRDDIKIVRSGKKTKIQISYEVVRHIVYNISLIMTFDEQVELSAN
jgi:hypothetical protein